MSECRVRHSRRLNRWLYGDDVLLCYTIYLRGRVYGGIYPLAEFTINIVFFAIRGETQHVRRSYLWERRFGNARKERTASAST